MMNSTLTTSFLAALLLHLFQPLLHTNKTIKECNHHKINIVRVTVGFK